MTVILPKLRTSNYYVCNDKDLLISRKSPRFRKNSKKLIREARLLKREKPNNNKRESRKVIIVLGFFRATVLLPKVKDIENLIKGLGKMWKTEKLNDVQSNMKKRRLKQLNMGQLGKYYEHDQVTFSCYVNESL